jgi:hypothetical protein
MKRRDLGGVAGRPEYQIILTYGGYSTATHLLSGETRSEWAGKIWYARHTLKRLVDLPAWKKE